MTVTVEVKRILHQSETLTVFVGWYEDLSISFRCQGTLTFIPCEKDKITMHGQFHPQFGDQVFFFFSAERFVLQPIKQAIAMIKVERDCKDLKKSQKRKAKDMEMSFREYTAGYVPENVKWNIPVDYYGAASMAATNEYRMPIADCVDEAVQHYADRNLDKKTVFGYALRILWHTKGKDYTKRITDKFVNRWNVYHNRQFCRQTIAVSAEKACNNVRFSMFGTTVADDGSWTADAVDVPWRNDLPKENEK